MEHEYNLCSQMPESIDPPHWNSYEVKIGCIQILGNRLLVNELVVRIIGERYTPYESAILISDDLRTALMYMLVFHELNFDMLKNEADKTIFNRLIERALFNAIN